MNRRLFGRAGLSIFVGLFTSPVQAGDAKKHRIAFQISVDDRRSQSLVLGNVDNYAKHYQTKGDTYAIEIVVFGPGYSMVRGDISMMKGELETLQKHLGASLVVSACRNTREAIAASMGKKADEIPLLPGVDDTPSGVVRLAELQEQGWAYIRP